MDTVDVISAALPPHNVAHSSEERHPDCRICQIVVLVETGVITSDLANEICYRDDAADLEAYERMLDLGAIDHMRDHHHRGIRPLGSGYECVTCGGLFRPPITPVDQWQHLMEEE